MTFASQVSHDVAILMMVLSSIVQAVAANKWIFTVHQLEALLQQVMHSFIENCSSVEENVCDVDTIFELFSFAILYEEFFAQLGEDVQFASELLILSFAHNIEICSRKNQFQSSKFARTNCKISDIKIICHHYLFNQARDLGVYFLILVFVWTRI